MSFYALPCSHECMWALTHTKMAPRTRNKKKTKWITSPPQIGNNFGRPPGTATTIAGPSLAPTPVPNQRRCLPHHQNDNGATNIACNMDAHQVDHNPPRFKAPQDHKGLESFLGLAVYFTAYIPYFSWIATPLFKCLCRKDLGFAWARIRVRHLS